MQEQEGSEILAAAPESAVEEELINEGRRCPEEELRKQLAYCEPGSRDYAILSDELQRRFLNRAGTAASDLSDSSTRIEKLTWVLIGLTANLILLAVLPAWDAVTKLLAN